MTGRPHLPCVALAFALVAGGCVMDFDSPTIIQNVRPLGARITVNGDPRLATIVPGDTVLTEFLVVSPDNRTFTFALELCAAVVAPTGDRICVGGTLTELVQPNPTSENPRFEVMIPTDPAAFAPDLTPEEQEAAQDIAGVDDPDDLVNAIEEALIRGVICEGGTPLRDEEGLFQCTADGRSVPLEFSVPIFDPDPNTNPDMDSWTVTLNDAPWPLPTGSVDPVAPCAAAAGDLGIPTVQAGQDPVLTFTANASDFDPLSDGEVEEIQFSAFTTLGEMERQFTFFENTEPETLEWEAKDNDEQVELTAQGRFARFFFVGRDLRGGADWIERVACLVPGAP